ncbi:anti-sigma factor [Desulfosporosinus hippei]|uniref:Sigma factor regulator N-terminal n=1 Tax=Desulfosporosinus hippei DSM 8344 TaxID=1121419 RepID=A0A1G8BEQ1_9FIRM|nr:anti-sigma factor [Desulfosporosinus hippei]SDH31712.1 Sigma factor regulator N-terminal [Desulfosporosinus hippei DSM 8344]
MGDREFDEIFENDESDMVIKKVRKKSTRKTILMSLVMGVVVLIGILVTNAAITIKLSNEMFYVNEANIKLHVPNGYISKSDDSMGFLGGRSDFTVSRLVGEKPVVLENKAAPFGLIPQLFMSRSQGGSSQSAGEWPRNYWENSYSKMIFFHPEISYKEYKNDLHELNRISDDKLIEVGISFDKPYKVAEIQTILPIVNKSWYWVDACSKDVFERYKKEASEYDGKATFISEYEALGVNVRAYGGEDFYGSYYNFVEALKSSKDKKYNEIYNELVTKGYTDPNNAPILGVIVYGMKDELKTLIGNPHIKASSFGVVVDKY